ncbi:alpha/beta-hydrolase [Pholiota conissans]|uniref:Alpha/beta-hydrolase n=1 Tax=Pholiota conissans TaxID=109636 RepID=A0A9P5ZAY4_9AGAR|nr:alpha/beta-hydrolase [Pholiota conissans]
MSSVTVSNNITFHYTDSGSVDQSNEYTTVIMVHGICFHSEVFRRLLPLAKTHGLRIISVARRGYLGSTPYTTDEKNVLYNGTVEQQSIFLNSQGALLALFVDAVIQKHSIPEAGGIAILGWSMGNIFPMAMLAAMHTLPPDSKERLKRYLRSYICFEAPNVAFGIPCDEGTYSPLTDPSIPPQNRVDAFKIWVSGYFKHGDLSTKDFAQLNQRDFESNARKPTVSTMSDEECASMFDASTGAEFDAPVTSPGNFESILRSLTPKALFDSEIRREWGRLRIHFMFGENTIWPIISPMWELEERARWAGIEHEFVKGGNHFLMWDEPETFMNSLNIILSKPQIDS